MDSTKAGKKLPEKTQSQSNKDNNWNWPCCKSLKENKNLQRRKKIFLISKNRFLRMFLTQSYLNGFEETEYQTKSRTEDYIMFCINHNRFGLAQSHIERYNAGEKQVILTPEQTQELDAKHFSQTQPAETIYVPARGEDTVVQSQAPLFKIEEVETQIEQMYEYMIFKYLNIMEQHLPAKSPLKYTAFGTNRTRFVDSQIAFYQPSATTNKLASSKRRMSIVKQSSARRTA
ncbi:Hypothetical_protein [Hexamita inflata]|uniref:Hypothetical_protein n=1 Tax=Hexamita inflata TaxID=28002 RepID=A0AA86TZV3_9EUKA|nr:Hypothetical protein HINF_LOCUS22454 [Hexamita inflata]